jgi:hypothetical protein
MGGENREFNLCLFLENPDIFNQSKFIYIINKMELRMLKRYAWIGILALMVLWAVSAFVFDGGRQVIHYAFSMAQNGFLTPIP